jgi:hypothetical protein
MSSDENEAAANFTGSQPGGFTRLFIDENIYSPGMFTDPPNYFGNVPDSQPGNNSTPRAGQSSAPPQAQKKRQPMKWTWPEDKRLICCWLNTSKDAIKGNDRTAATFWKTIETSYNEDPTLPDREFGHMKNHWNKVFPRVKRFDGCMKEVLRTYRSGCNEPMLIDMAMEAYALDAVKRKEPPVFTYIEWWKELRHEPKFTAEEGLMGEKRTRLDEGGRYSSSSAPSPATASEPEVGNESQPEWTPSSPVELSSSPPPPPTQQVRPPGQKAAKRKAKGKAVEESQKFPQATEFVRAKAHMMNIGLRATLTKQLWDLEEKDTSVMNAVQFEVWQERRKYMKEQLDDIKEQLNAK